MARWPLLCFLLAALLAFLADARPIPGPATRTALLELDGPGLAADPPSLSEPPSGEKLDIAGGPENAQRHGKKHQSFEKSVACGEVILGGFAAAIFVVVFAYIRVTRRRSCEENKS